MSEWRFSVGESGGKRMKTAGKYCDRDIRVDLDEAIPEEVNAQAGLLAQIQTALEGKAAGGGGGNVETCTVIIKIRDGEFYAFAYTEYIDGNIKIKLREITREESLIIREFVLENVVCGTMIVINHNLTYQGVIVSDNIELLRSHPSNAWFKAPENNGDEATIEIYNNM